MEQIDQEITLQLQRIDSNLNHCFAKISREIIPCVEKYGSVCDELVDSVSHLAGLFRGTGDVALQGQENVISESQPAEKTEDVEDGINADVDTLETNSTNDSTRQRRKRKVSLLLQQEYGSSSPREEEEDYVAEEGTLPSVAVLKFNTGNNNINPYDDNGGDEA
ncbi:hypothetical protein ZYGR_0R00520 [Zygosaccharomyces rouxii]|uniref:DASH complex subunit ASK1 n=2 Tax=Zygosaccharomyces rouxii TaxID=4956 RepID=C5DX07_ZYGRC|nr:uncharacterized protein ZYRO0F01232g [Zygosaccharomyces rouxii]KAH9199083.1 DASH complex subunit Ask1-domain-containing protein [Zygosaccharomyces rouxii]GAV49811.1 hypothetical protein ZYGR_0R00520 [Zygosaccharomyces rouxii]CAR28318.1 ZYRO0F01232p [Zygosaccharomyces rouxii]